MKSYVKIWGDGTEIYKNSKGEMHREGGPAYRDTDGHEEWYLNGRRHRANGPAITWRDGGYRWYLHGYHYTVDVYAKELFGDTPEATAFLLKWAT